MSEHQRPNRDPVLAPSTFPDDGDEEYTLLIESQEIEFDDEDDEEIEGSLTTR